MRIDAHQHFWQFDPVRDNWINEEMAVIQRDFMPADLAPILQANGFDGCVAVQADQSEEQTNFLVDLASQHAFIKGVVGWVDLQADNIAERLAHFRQFPVVKGFRHVLQGEPQRDLMLTPAFQRGISELEPAGFAYDLLIFPDQIAFCETLVKNFPNQRFVVDHLAKPYIKKGEIDQWEKDMRQLAQHPNTWCKLSGLVTEADWQHWTKADFRPYIDVMLEAFGAGRLLFGSDWPVCLVAGSYPQVVELVAEHIALLSASEQQQIFGGNAAAFYQLT